LARATSMPWLMLVLAPGFSHDPAKFELAVMLARIALDAGPSLQTHLSSLAMFLMVADG